ncbi:MAG: 23S rRNA (pseudouridine(1915)-N(3))-methyltransferase RlmH [Desulfobacca sp.]|nr:23S rRNA (pseudouridine(1915)-N(3))-methyltransferase RlmH [Desulfobacca sp.]
MKFLIATTGKIKENFIQKGVQEYNRRINHYTELRFFSVKEERIVKGVSESGIIQKEGERILAKVPRDGLWVALERQGQEMNTLQHFEFINIQAQKGIKKIVYLIGGPLGLSRDVLVQSSQILCLSRMTLTHELSALFLIEQIYRYVNFMSGEKYHK